MVENRPTIFYGPFNEITPIDVANAFVEGVVMNANGHKFQNV
jgi:hypothetical protein